MEVILFTEGAQLDAVRAGGKSKHRVWEMLREQSPCRTDPGVPVQN